MIKKDYDESSDSRKKSHFRRCKADVYIPHQANKRIIDAVGERIGLSEDRMFVNVHKYGNTSSATMAVALDEAITTDKVGPGDIVLIVAVGSGLTWAATAIRL